MLTLLIIIISVIYGIGSLILAVIFFIGGAGFSSARVNKGYVIRAILVTLYWPIYVPGFLIYDFIMSKRNIIHPEDWE